MPVLEIEALRPAVRVPLWAMPDVSEPESFGSRHKGEPLSLRGRTILVVEDESLVALLLQDAIEAAGGTVVGPCYTFAEAGASAANEAFDAAVLDVDPSGIDVFLRPTNSSAAVFLSCSTPRTRTETRSRPASEA